MVSNTDALNEAIELLKSINCPEPIMDALWLFSFMVNQDGAKLKDWNAWCKGQSVEGESVDFMPAGAPRLPTP